MKKNNLLKAIFIAFIFVVVLTWIIPNGTFTETEFTNNGTMPVGIINLFRLPIMTMQTFVQYTLVFLCIGALYGVLNKTGVYDNVVKSIAKKWKGKEKTLLIIISIAFALIGSLTGLSMVAFIVIPFVAAILLSAGYDKMSSMLATVGSLLVGEAASLFGFNSVGYIINIFNITMTHEIITRIILFVLLTGLYLFFVVKKSKIGTENADRSIPLFSSDQENGRSSMPFIITSIVFIIIVFIGSYNWYYGWNISLFNNLDSKISSIQIHGYPILANILNGISALGYWGNYEIAVAIIIFTFLIGWLYNVKLSDILDGIKKGVKEILPVAFYATICNIIFSIMLANTGTIYNTLLNYFAGIKDSFNIPVLSLISLTGSVFYNDFYYLLYSAANVISSYEAVYHSVTGVLMSGIFGIMMMFLPTSIVLVAGLKYFNISYTEWLKNIWKYLLEALFILMLVVIIVTLLI